MSIAALSVDSGKTPEKREYSNAGLHLYCTDGRDIHRGPPYLPVIILTTSKSEEDKARSYDLCVNAYLKKPVGFKNLSSAVKAIKQSILGNG